MKQSIMAAFLFLCGWWCSRNEGEKRRTEKETEKEKEKQKTK